MTLRIVFCLDGSGIGGTELHAVRTTERLAGLGHKVSIATISPEPVLADRYRDAGAEVRTFPIPSLASPRSLREGRRLARLLAEEGVQVFHALDSYGNIFGVPWARIAGVPAVLASRRWWRSEVRRGHRLGNRVAYRMAHGVTANSPRVGSLAQEEAGRGKPVWVVPNHVDEEAFQASSPEFQRRFREELRIPEGRTLIGCVANLRPVKDHRTLLRAFAQVASSDFDVHLVLVGEGRCRSDLEELSRDLRCRHRVAFAGLRAQPPNLHHLFQISALTSVSEASSNSILEAMAAGTPVVATAVGGSPDLVVEGQTGLLIPPGNPQAAAEAILRLLKDPTLSGKLGEAGRRRASEHFSPEATMAALLDVYHTVLAPEAIGRVRFAGPPALVSSERGRSDR